MGQRRKRNENGELKRVSYELVVAILAKYGRFEHDRDFATELYYAMGDKTKKEKERFKKVVRQKEAEWNGSVDLMGAVLGTAYDKTAEVADLLLENGLDEFGLKLLSRAVRTSSTAEFYRPYLEVAKKHNNELYDKIREKVFNQITKQSELREWDEKDKEMGTENKMRTYLEKQNAEFEDLLLDYFHPMPQHLS